MATTTISSTTGDAALPTKETGVLLQIGNADSTTTAVELDSFNAGCQVIGKRAQGTIASKTAATNNAALLLLAGIPYDGTVYSSGNTVNIQLCCAETQASGAHGSYIKFNTTPIGSTTIAEAVRITDVAVVKTGGNVNRGTTEGTNHLDIFDGTAPVGTLANGVSLYSSGGKLWAMDAAGNATKLTP